MPKKATHDDSDSELARQIRECADECGLTDHLAKGAAGAPVGGLGDGVLLGKFLELFKLLLPILIPLITDDKKA